MSDEVSPKPHRNPEAEPRLRLEPFRAWHFVAGRVTTLGAVTSPPYDVLEPAIIRRLTESDLHNMVRLILPRDPALGPSRYDEAAARLTRWQRDGVVAQDSRAALYVYEQRVGDAMLCGLVGALGLDPTGRVVIPHENVMDTWVDDRYTLMQATQADLEPILLAYAGKGAAADVIDEMRTREPWLLAETENGATHRLWRIESDADLAAIEQDLAQTEALIADGHHRYAAYLQRRHRQPERPGTAYGLAMLVDNQRHPLTLDAIHRTVPRLTLDQVRTRTPPHWTVRDGRAELPVIVTDGTAWLALQPPHNDRPGVSLLHEELLPAWGVDVGTMDFHHDWRDALERATPTVAAIALEPPTMEQVLRTAAEGGRLPQKATSFGPKPRAGLVFRTLPDHSTSS